DAVDGQGHEVLGRQGRLASSGGSARGHSHAFTSVRWSAQAVDLAGSKGLPRPVMCCSYSSRKYFSEEKIGEAAPSPRAQKDLPLMLSAMSLSLSRSDILPLPASMSRISWTSQYVPSRQGVHLPQDSWA